jgi:hypothetical protein
MQALSESEPVGDKANENHQASCKWMDILCCEGLTCAPSLLQVEKVRVDNHNILECASHRCDYISQEEVSKFNGAEWRSHNFL